MNSKIVIIALLQFSLLCTPLVLQSAALDLEGSPDQRWICRELCPAIIEQNNPLPVKNHRMLPPQDLIQNNAKRQQGDLLQELLVAEVISHVSMQQSVKTGIAQRNSLDNIRQDNKLLKEITAETSMQ